MYMVLYGLKRDKTIKKSTVFMGINDSKSVLTYLLGLLLCVLVKYTIIFYYFKSFRVSILSRKN